MNELQNSIYNMNRWGDKWRELCIKEHSKQRLYFSNKVVKLDPHNQIAWFNLAILHGFGHAGLPVNKKASFRFAYKSWRCGNDVAADFMRKLYPLRFFTFLLVSMIVRRLGAK